MHQFQLLHKIPQDVNALLIILQTGRETMMMTATMSITLPVVDGIAFIRLAHGNSTHLIAHGHALMFLKAIQVVNSHAMKLKL